MPDIYRLKVTLTDWEARVRGQPYRVLAVTDDSSLHDLALAINEAFDFNFDHAFGFYDRLKDPYGSSERYELFADMDEEDLEDMDEALDALDEAELAEIFGTDDSEELASLPDMATVLAELGQFADEEPEKFKEAVMMAALEGVPEDQREQAQAELEEAMDRMDELEGETRGVEGTLVSETFTKGKKLLYLFDYGDEWRFIVQCQSVESAKRGEDYPQVLESEGDAPEQYPELEDEEYDFQEGESN